MKVNRLLANKERRFAAAFVVVVLLATMVGVSSAAVTTPATPLYYATSKSATSAKTLQGAAVQGVLYIHLPKTALQITSVSYYWDNLDGTGKVLYRSTTAPFSLARGIDVSTISGVHTLMAVATTATGQTSSFSARFTVTKATRAAVPGQPSPAGTTGATTTGTPPAATTPAKVATVPAAGTEICETFGSTNVSGGAYMVQNNRWGDDTEQCVKAFDGGFSVTKASHAKDDGPAAYPSIMYGCWMQTCTTGSKLPAQVSAFPALTSNIQAIAPSSDKYNLAYDIWADPTPRKDGQNTGAELMIWLKEVGDVAPIGEKNATATIGGATWDVWTGTNGEVPVISWVRKGYVTSATLPLADFVKDATTRGVVQPGWYITNVQAGFEPWTGGQGLAITSFDVK